MTTPDQPPQPPAGDAPGQGSGASVPPTSAAQDGPPSAPTWGPAPQYGHYGSAPEQGKQPGYGGQYGQYGQSQYGQYGQQQYGQQQYGAPGYGPPVPPVDKPGIIPLRPLRLGEIYDGAFGALRKNPAVMLGVSSAILAAATIIAAVLTWAFSNVAATWAVSFDSALGAELGASAAGAADDSYGLMLTLLGSIVQSLAFLIVTPLVTGLLIITVSQAVIGRRPTFAQVRESARGRVWRLLVWTLLVLVGSLVVGGVTVGLVVVLAVASVEVSAGLTFLIVVVGIGAYLAIALWLTTRVLLVPAAIALEGQTLGQAILRGWRLTRGYFWRLLGISLLTQVVLGFIAGLIAQPFAFIAEFAVPNDPALGLVLSMFGSLVGSILTTVITAAVVSLLYIDVRMRSEGLDIELAAAARSSAQG